MATQSTTPQRSLLLTVILILVCIFLPVIGHIILTFMILNDYLSTGEKIVWLLAVWLLWFAGPFLYLLVGQRRNRLFGGHAWL